MSSNILIEVLSIEPPAPGKKVAIVTTTTGAALEIFPEKMSELRPGARYNVELKEREFKGRTYRTITKIDAPNESAAPRQQSHPSAPVAAGTPEQFCATLLAAYIRAGEIKLGDEKLLADTTSMLKRLWNWGFGENLRNTKTG